MLFEDDRITPAMLAILTDGEMDESDSDMIVTSIDEINDRQEDALWFVIGYAKSVVEIMGCPSKSGLLRLADHLSVFNITSPSIVIHADICNPEELPLEVPSSKSIVVIFGEHTLNIYHSMDLATAFIEETLVQYDQCEISDFAVLIGHEAEFNEDEWSEIIMNGAQRYVLC